jgi:sugar O-acyltransferase (sialic acid O-acetyltransferase NeuD family)
MLEQLVVVGAATPTIIRVVDDINQAGNRNIRLVGFVDNAHAVMGTDFFGSSILGGFEVIKTFDPEQVLLINTIAGSIDKRVETTAYFLSLGYKFTNIIHPRVNTKYVEMGTGNLIYENALIQPFVAMGDHCVISSNAGVAHETWIGDYCFIGPASYICGKVRIEQRTFIGAGAKVLPRLTIGKGAHIGACSLVNKSVADGQRIKGIPGRQV